MRGTIHDIHQRPVEVRAARATLHGDLALPDQAHGVVLFAHGSGSSRFSSRNRAVAQYLNAGGFATLLLDLLSADEETVDRATGELRFDIPFLGERLILAADWLAREPETATLPLGLFGASTGAAAALITAAERADSVRAVVSRGGRPDLAAPALGRVRAPTLLIVGGADETVLELNRTASAALQCEKRLAVIPRATHLFPEPGTLEEVARLALGWMREHVSCEL
ncbi:MAG TPA: dienelactone hydrolase family protein [Gemmatimonadales bacterium]|nr:dienelactone hydrolase family protein [Gemmatimonadales bacterium]